MAMVGVSHSGFHYLPLGSRVAARVEVLLALTALRMMLEVGELRLRVTRTVPRHEVNLRLVAAVLRRRGCQ